MHVHTDASSDLPSGKEFTDDVTELFDSIFHLSWLIITSSTFRILLSDIVLTVQELAATVAVDVETVASQVQASASQVESAARSEDLSLDGAKERIRETRHEIGRLAEEEGQRLVELKTETSEKLRDTIVTRVQQVLWYFRKFLHCPPMSSTDHSIGTE